MSLHTARKKVDELTNEELDKELDSANKLFVDLDWRYEYNRRIKLFKEYKECKIVRNCKCGGCKKRAGSRRPSASRMTPGQARGRLKGAVIYSISEETRRD